MSAAKAGVLCAVLLALAACSERPVVYKQGQYQGKVDGIPWENAQFKGNRTEWEKTIKARSQGQDEYARANPSPIK